MILNLHIYIDKINPLILRRQKRYEFIKLHKKLIKKASKHGTSHSCYDSPEGRKLVRKARRQLKYANSTYSGDIYALLMRDFKKKLYKS